MMHYRRDFIFHKLLKSSQKPTYLHKIYKLQKNSAFGFEVLTTIVTM